MINRIHPVLSPFNEACHDVAYTAVPKIEADQMDLMCCSHCGWGGLKVDRSALDLAEYETNSHTILPALLGIEPNTEYKNHQRTLAANRDEEAAVRTLVGAGLSRKPMKKVYYWQKRPKLRMLSPS